jgi:phage gp45-like
MNDFDRIIEAMTTRYFGKYRGEVTDTADPTSRGRVKVRVPAVMGDREVWAMPCAPYAGDGLGFFAIPPAGTAVWVEFEGGELNQPIWAGCFWRDGEIDSADAVEKVFFLRTPGVTIRVDNDSGEVVIESAAGAKITLDQSGVTIEATKIEFSANGGSATLSATGFDAMSGALTVGP